MPLSVKDEPSDTPEDTSENDLWDRVDLASPGAPPEPPPAASVITPPSAPPANPPSALAIVGIVTSFLFGPLGIILGHISLSRAKKSGEDRSLSIISIFVGWIMTVLGIITFIPFLLGLLLFSSASSIDDGGRIGIDQPPVFEYPEELEIYEYELPPED